MEKKKMSTLDRRVVRSPILSCCSIDLPLLGLLFLVFLASAHAALLDSQEKRAL